MILAQTRCRNRRWSQTCWNIHGLAIAANEMPGLAKLSNSKQDKNKQLSGRLQLCSEKGEAIPCWRNVHIYLQRLILLSKQTTTRHRVHGVWGPIHKRLLNPHSDIASGQASFKTKAGHKPKSDSLDSITTNRRWQPILPPLFVQSVRQATRRRD